MAIAALPAGVACAGVASRAGGRGVPRTEVAGAAAAVLLSEGRENAPLAAYGGLLATLSALATSVDRSHGPAASVLSVAGPVFLLSDSLILARRKVRGGTVPARALDVGVIDTYATAALQLLTGTASAARHAGSRA